MSMFFDLKKNKGKNRNKPKEEIVELSTADPEILAEEDVAALLDSLNDIPVEEPKLHGLTTQTIRQTESVIKSEDTKIVDSGKTFKAYGLCHSDKDKKVMLISIDYNPETGYSKVVSVEPYTDNVPTALSKLNRVISLRLLKKEEVY